MKVKEILTAFILLNLCLPVDSFCSIDVKYGIYINNISLSNKDETFKAEFYWLIKIPHEKGNIDTHDIANIEFVNAIEIISNERINVVSNEVNDNAETEKFYYIHGICRGVFRFYPEFSNYPLDTQHLPIIIESLNLEQGLVRLIPDNESYANSCPYSGIDNGVKGTTFAFVNASFDTSTTIYNTSFGNVRSIVNSHYSRITYNIMLKRIPKGYLLKIFIPNIILLIIAYLVFYIPAKDLEVAVGCTVTTILACIALQLITNDDLPNIGYLTKSDSIYYVTYVFLASALIQTVITYNLEKNSRLKIANALEKMGRILYFPAYFAACYFVLMH